MNQFESDSEKNLNQKVHGDVHDSNVHEHVGHKTPSLVTPPRIVDENLSCRSIHIEAHVVDVFILVFSKIRGKLKCLASQK